MNKHATKCKSATENYILKFLTVSSVSSDSIVKGIIDDIAVKTAEVDEQKTKYLQHFINKHDTLDEQLSLEGEINVNEASKVYKK
jgi:hypothetical protein